MRAGVLILFVLVGGFAIGCEEGIRPQPHATPAPSTEPPPDPREGLAPWSDAWIVAHASRFIDDDAARREGLIRSLTRDDNLYARTRLGAYGHVTRGWDALPEWNPQTRPIDRATADALADGASLSLEGAQRVWNGERPQSLEGWRALGRRVFFELPLRSEPFWMVAVRDPERAARLGVERAPDGSIPGLVIMRDVDRAPAIGITCALCHSARSPDGGSLIEGRARRSLDYGAVRIAYFESIGQAIDPLARGRWERWGPGRADVLEDVADTPIAIVDLYGLRHQRLLTQAGTIRHDDPLALAVRQETQYIQANHHHTRPPRTLMFALAVYLYSLEAPSRRPSPEPPEVLARGRDIFRVQCAECHDNPVLSGDEVIEIDRVGTDPELATGNARGTGGYRPAPLVAVADAAPYLHHGAVPSLGALLSRERLDEGYRGSAAGPGPVPGHEFGTYLTDGDRAALIAHLDSL